MKIKEELISRYAASYSKFNPLYMSRYLKPSDGGILYLDRDSMCRTVEDTSQLYFVMNRYYGAIDWNAIERLTLYYKLHNSDVYGGIMNLSNMTTNRMKPIISVKGETPYVYSETDMIEFKKLFKIDIDNES